jgi:hypothetical protein
MFLRAASTFLVLAAAAGLSGCDTVRVSNAFSTTGLLVDGATSGAAIVNDRRRTRDGDGVVSVNVGRLSLSSGRNETIAFGMNRAPVRAATAWSRSRDTFDLRLGDPIAIGVTNWIVQGPFDAQRTHAFTSCLQTLGIWFWERTGFLLNNCDMRDATRDPDITNAILNSVGGDNRNWNDFSTLIGFDAGRINIYWINTVEGATTTGWSDFGGRIVMGRNTGFELLVHEIGHGFSLFHPVACGGSTALWDDTNIMAPCSATREFATEGQIFRMHFNPGSSVNALYGARPGAPTEDCQNAGETAACPAVERRLWDDGSFLAN